MITLIDYGVGNIKAFLNIYKQLNIPARAVNRKEDLEGSTKLILPGVGHFDYAMQRFADSGMMHAVNDLVLNQMLPVIGICVGMQMMAARSDEGVLRGLNWIPGEVKKFPQEQQSSKMPLPHMGWNDVSPSFRAENPLFKNIENCRFYFLHSYYFLCQEQTASIGEASYGIDFSCAVNKGNVYGVQFHPEKSHHFGVQLLKNFAELC